MSVISLQISSAVLLRKGDEVFHLVNWAEFLPQRAPGSLTVWSAQWIPILPLHGTFSLAAPRSDHLWSVVVVLHRPRPPRSVQPGAGFPGADCTPPRYRSQPSGPVESTALALKGAWPWMWQQVRWYPDALSWSSVKLISQGK